MKFRVPEIALGALLAIAVFAIGMLFASLHQPSPSTKNQRQQTETTAQNGLGSKSTAVEHAADSQAAQHKEEKSEFWSAKLTDWLLALFTFFLVAFTAALVRSTNRLWDAAREQAKLTESAFSQLEGPLIEGSNLDFKIALGPRLPTDETPKLEFWLKNRGRGPGFITEMCGRFMMLPGGIIPPVPDYGEVFRSNTAIGPNEEIPHPLEFILETPPGSGIAEVALFFFGYVKYRGVFGGVSTWAWGFTANNQTGRFDIRGGTAYNYRKYEPATQ